MHDQYKRGFGSALILVAVLVAAARIGQWLQTTDVVAWLTTPQVSPLTIVTLGLLAVTLVAAFIWMPGRVSGGLSM